MEKTPTWTCVVALALRDRQGRWLMHRRPRHKQHGGLWEFPGGKVEPGENPAQALVREIDEELGLVVDPGTLKPAGFAQEAPGASAAPIVILLYTSLARDAVVEAREGGSVEWFTPSQIATLPRPPLDLELCLQLFGEPAT